MTRQYAPRGLGDAGRRLWRSVVTAYPELTVGEKLLLAEAARAADLIDGLNARAARPGCPRGTLVELRLQRAALARLIDQLKI